MINICVSSDSRGITSKTDNTWVNILKSSNPEYCVKRSRENWVFFTTIWEHLISIKEMNVKFDIGIIQLGYHEYVVPWKMSVWETLESSINMDLKSNLTPFQNQTIGGHNFKNCYTYRNDENIKQTFSEIRKYCDKLIFIKMPYSWEPFLQNTKIMNSVFSNCCDDVVSMPMDKDFPLNNTFNIGIDRVHYLDHYHKIISDKVIEKINILK